VSQFLMPYKVVMVSYLVNQNNINATITIKGGAGKGR
jgi:hypothetical protein